jgi:tetratricopeptide (TPR) repeat protein
LILLASVVLVFGRLLLCDFTWWDDPHTIHQNPRMNPVTWETFRFHWTTPVASIYVPLTYTVWALLAMVSRIDPGPDGISLNATFFHGASLLIHAAGALMAFALLRRLTKNDLAALLGALLWAVHPTQVESLGWISGLKDVLSGTLVLATLVAYLRFRDATGKPRTRWYAVALGLYTLALLAKPSAMTTPLLVIALDRLVLGTAWRAIAVAMLPFAVVTLPLAMVARAVQQAPAARTPLWIRPLLVGDALTFYAHQVLAPVHLAFDYGRSVAYLRTQSILYYAWLLPVGVAAVTLWAYRRARRAGRPLSPLPAVGLLMFVLAPVHVLGLTRFDFQIISTVADHYLYVALIGPAILLAWSVTRWPACAKAGVLLVAVYGLRAAWLTPVWQDDYALLEHTLTVNPRSWTAYMNLSTLERERLNIDKQYTYLSRAREIESNNPTIELNLLSFYIDQKELDNAHATARRLIELYQSLWREEGAPAAAAHVKIVGMFIDADRFDDAEMYLREGLALDPQDRALAVYAQRLEWKRRMTTTRATL